MNTLPPLWIKPRPGPWSVGLRRRPRGAIRSMSSVIGEPPLTILPDTCTALALSAAERAAATICAGDFDAMPLPPEELPQPASAPHSRTAIAQGARREGRGPIAGTL